MQCTPRVFSIFFFNDTATTEIYTLSLHDALPISLPRAARRKRRNIINVCGKRMSSSACAKGTFAFHRSEEHTSELQSHLNLVCRLLLEKKKIIISLKNKCMVNQVIRQLICNYTHV